MKCVERDHQVKKRTGLSSQSLPYSSICSLRSLIIGAKCLVPLLLCEWTLVNKRPASLNECQRYDMSRDRNHAYGLKNIGNKLMIAAAFVTSIVNSTFSAIQSVFRPANDKNIRIGFLWKQMRLTKRFPHKHPIAGPTYDLHHGFCNFNLAPF